MRNVGTLLTLVIAILVGSALAKTSSGKPPSVPCIVFYSLSTSGVYGSHNFTGVKVIAGLASSNIPLYYKLSDAMSGTAIPDGELFSTFAVTNLFGPWSFRFFATGSWIATTIAFQVEPDDIGVETVETVEQEIEEGDVNPVTGGTGCFLGITGFIVYSTVTQAITQWSVCPEKLSRCRAGKA